MGLRHTVHAFACTDIAGFKAAMKTVATRCGGTFSDTPPRDPAAGIRVSQGPNAISLVHETRENIHPFYTKLSQQLGGAPFLIGRIQEGTLWDYGLHRGLLSLDQFSTYPQYWEGDEQDPVELLYRKGRPEFLSLIFGVPRERFERYLLPWYSGWNEETGEYATPLEGKAYPDDHAPYRDYEQLWDFLHSLGITDPCGRPETPPHRWELSLPDPLPR